MFKIRFLPEWFISVALFCSCQLGNNEGAELPNELTGQLYTNGGAPAVNARVTLYPLNYIPGNANSDATLKTTSTDHAGRFQFSRIAAGQYNILGKMAASTAGQDSLYSFTDSVSISGSAQTLPADTLSSPGTLTGSVQLQPGDDPRTVLLLVMGTNTLAFPDSLGNFTLANLAQGRYSLRILTTLDKYLPLDVSVNLRSGIQDVLTSSIVLPFKGIPNIMGLTLRYDTLLQIATLSWKPADTSLVSGYNVYRKHMDSNFVKVTPNKIVSPFYADSLMIQDDNYSFRIKVVDKNENEGNFSYQITVQTMAAYAPEDSFNVGALTPGANLTSLHYNGAGLMIAEGLTGVNGRRAFFIMDTSFKVISRFETDSIAAIKGMDRKNHIWTDANIKDQTMFNLPKTVRCLSIQGAIVGDIKDYGPNLEWYDNLSALASKGNKVYTAGTIGGGFEIRAYDDSTLQFIKTVLRYTNPTTSNVLSPLYFDVSTDQNLRFLANDKLFVLDSLGNILSQQSLAFSNVKAFNAIPGGGYLAFHCGDQTQSPCYYDVLNEQLQRKALFLGRLNRSDVVSGFVDNQGRLFILNGNGIIKVYRPR